ncbi:methylisocitrate lyase [Pontibacillus halophilus JSM 076056 = DSM 19796]|uniref:Methylisocitrate lyase n=1 Tax=Pontibacillus halophilus JSM 076056 = DSM 19796 TaxID=1385510 RepID=A0A0A5GH59_9BACI|nr:methylisocitrate lyase [Pontibacillus halophilus]KGX91369.1 methylisocitrate lyase [Pontibacillus halophilus JSM 076056 = DSM 19796]
MTWIVEPKSTQAERAAKLQQLIQQDDILKIPGAHDGMSAKIAKDVGFQAIYLSGAAYTASRALPDLGMIYSNEVADKARELVRASDLPLLVDIDTGYGGVLSVARTATEMVEAGVAAVQIEDQLLPKKCGHLNGKKLVEAEEMMSKIKAIKEVAPTLLVVARTDAKSVEGLDEAIERANLYVEAGADAIFPEALTSEEDFRKASHAINAPVLANMTEFGKTPYFKAEEFESFGFQMVIYPVTSLRVAAKAYERVFTEILEQDTQQGMLDDMQTRAELYDTIRYYDYEKLDQDIAQTILPEIGKESK